MAEPTRPLLHGAAHVAALQAALSALDVERVTRWGRRLARALLAGRRVLACGNGGSAAQAQHLTAELVGRYRDDRRPFPAIALHTDTSATTAIGNDYGRDAVFARQVQAHGAPGDLLVAMSTSGRSSNVLAAVHAAHRRGLTVVALTGPAPNPLADRVDEPITAPGPETATVQEAHLVVAHLLCAEVDLALGDGRAATIDLSGSVVGARGGGRP